MFHYSSGLDLWFRTVVDDFIHVYLYTTLHPPPSLAPTILQQNAGWRVEEGEGKLAKVERLGSAASGFDLIARSARTGTGRG